MNKTENKKKEDILKKAKKIVSIEGWSSEIFSKLQKQNIEKNEFLCVDYGTFMLTKQDYISNCNCGSENCRGKVTGKDYKFLNLPLSWYAQKVKNEDYNNRQS